MPDRPDAAQPLIEENALLRRRILDLERSEAECQQMEAPLRASQAQYRVLAEAAADMIFVVDREWRVQYVNSHAARQFGTVPMRVTGKRIESLLPPESVERLKQALQRVFDSGQRELDEDPIAFGERIVWLSSSLVPLRDESGVTTAVMGIGRDITDRKRAEEALRVSEQRLRSYLDNAGDAVYVLETATGRIRSCNARAFHDVGYSRDELLEMSASDLETVLTAEQIEELHGQLVPREPRTVTGRHRRKDGTTFPAEIRLSSLAPGDAGMLVAVVRDLSERVEAQEAKTALESRLQQTQKLESVGRLAGGVAHYFNNMLGVIIGHAQLGLRSLHPGHPLHADLIEIEAAAHRSADLTRQLLAFAREQTVRPRVLDPNEAVESALAMLRHLIGDNVRLTMRPGAHLWRVRIDPSQLEQIMVNLCLNGRDAVAGNGSITITTGNDSFDEAACAGLPGMTPGDYVRLSVADDGCGMGEDTLSRVFEPFFTTKGVGKGVGLGLASVHGAVRQNGGFITARSTLGSGTTFTIHLPRVHEEAAPAGPSRAAAPVDAARAAAPVSRGQGTILLVEDEPSLRKLVQRALEQSGYAVLAANSPAEAVRLAAEHAGQLQLLITDVVMPGMNGPTLANLVLSSNPRARCVFMSGYPADVLSDHGIVDDGLSFIQKPFSVTDLIARVRSTLNR